MRMHAFECAVEARELSSGSPFSFVVLALRVLHSGRTDTVATRGVRPVVQPSLSDSVSHFLLSLMSLMSVVSCGCGALRAAGGGAPRRAGFFVDHMKVKVNMRLCVYMLAATL